MEVDFKTKRCLGDASPPRHGVTVGTFTRGLSLTLRTYTYCKVPNFTNSDLTVASFYKEVLLNAGTVMTENSSAQWPTWGYLPRMWRCKPDGLHKNKPTLQGKFALNVFFTL